MEALTAAPRGALATSDTDPDRLLSDYTRAIRRHFPTVLVCTLIGAIMGAVIVALTPAVYNSSFSVLTPILPLYPAAGTGDRSARIDTVDTDARELTAVTLAAANGANVGIQITAAPLTRVLTIRVSGSDATQVGEISSAAAYRFVESFAETDRAAAASLSNDLRDQVGALSADISSLRRTARTLPTTDPRRIALQSATRTLSTELKAVNTTLTQVATRQYTYAEIVSAATEPRARRPGKVVKAASCVMLGLLAGLALAWRRRDRPRRRVVPRRRSAGHRPQEARP